MTNKNIEPLTEASCINYLLATYLDNKQASESIYDNAYEIDVQDMAAKEITMLDRKINLLMQLRKVGA